jgi:Skp family chaperone for outer membrane proteins
MSLTNDDLQAIREIIKDEVSTIVHSTVKEELHPISGELEALRNDIKEIYDMLSDLRNKSLPDRQFQKLSLEEKLLKLNSELLVAAKQAGITLPR